MAMSCSGESPVEDEWAHVPRSCDEYPPYEEAVENEVTRELDPPMLLLQEYPPIRTFEEWNTAYLQLKNSVMNMPTTRRRIIPNLPQDNNKRSLSKTIELYRLYFRAKEILERAFNNTTSYGSAHREWAFYQAKCEHDVHLHHAEARCFSCEDVEQQLNELQKTQVL